MARKKLLGRIGLLLLSLRFSWSRLDSFDSQDSNVVFDRAFGKVASSFE